MTFTFHRYAGPALRGRFLQFLACRVIWLTKSLMSNIKSIGQGVRGLRLPKFGGFPLTLNVALTTVLRTNVLHCDYWQWHCGVCGMWRSIYTALPMRSHKALNPASMFFRLSATCLRFTRSRIALIQIWWSHDPGNE